MREFNANFAKRNAARAAYDLEIELIARDYSFDRTGAIRLLENEEGAIGDHAASRLRHAWREFDWHRRYAHRILDHGLSR